MTMDITAVLEQIGLSEGEIKVYLALLKLDSAPVSKIKEETNLHRTTIYDFLEKLLNKGLVSHVIKNNVKFYTAAYPDRLLALIKEKEENVKEVLPELIKLAEFKKEDIKVEVYKGVEGLKTLFNDILRTDQDLIAFGVDETIFKKRFPLIMEQFLRKEEKAGIKERLLTSEKIRFVYKKKNLYYRYVPDEYFGPTPVMTYADRVVNLIWEPLTIIMIKNKELAQSYKRHFEMLWKNAKKIK
jgi:sugar-specific transcriptional regulator TrmB